MVSTEIGLQAHAEDWVLSDPAGEGIERLTGLHSPKDSGWNL
jgi:hypothetical protein